MNYFLLIILLCCIISIIILVFILKKKQKVLEKVIIEKHNVETARTEELKLYFEEEWNNAQQQLEYKTKEVEHDFQLRQVQISGEIDKLDTTLKEKEKRYNEVNQDLDLYREGRIKEIDGTAAEYERRKRTEIENFFEKQLHEMVETHNQRAEDYNNQEKELKEQIETIKTELEEERRKRATINEEIRRRREVEEQQDFYRIQLNPDDTNDIELLRSITPRLRHPEAINKVIWTGYYQKPLAELRKRLLPNGDISGIYKITRLKTNEIYIGQTTSVDKRWQDHVKTALGVGTLASSQLHRVMAQDGCENFTWEVLEETQKDKLRERESFYIDFYDSKTYGLNTISGDKK